MLTVISKDETIIGKDLLDAIPEFNQQEFIPHFQSVYDTGNSYYQPEGRVHVLVDGALKEMWFSYAYNPLPDDKGKVQGIICAASDITLLMQTRRQIEAVIK